MAVDRPLQAAHWMAHVMTPTDAKIHAGARFAPAGGLRRGRLAAAALLLALAAGCASGPPPRDTLLSAEAALARAEEARAADFAPMDLDFARRQHAAAVAALQERDGDAAARLAIQAELNAELAAAKSRAAAARADVQRLTGENAALRRDLLGEGDSR